MRSFWVYILASRPRGTLYKEWPRAWKVNLIERDNRHRLDLYPSLPGAVPIPES